MSSSIGFSATDQPARRYDRYISTIAICAAVIVAVRIARLPERELSTRSLATTVEGSVRLAATIFDEVRRIC